MDLLATLKTLINHEKRTLRNILSLLFVVALEALITTEKIFVCPSKNNATYGWMFIIAPAIVLAFLSVMLSEDFWKITQGICYHRAPRRKGKKMLSLCLRWNCKHCKDTSFAVVLYNGLAASCLWLFWAFLQGRYYMCAKEGNQDYMLQPAKIAGNKTEVNRINKIFDQAKTESQLIGFYIILVVVIGPSIMLSIYRCVYQRAISSIKDPEEVYEIEAMQAITTFNEKFTKKAEEIGKKKAEKFFQDQKQPTTLEDIYTKFKARTGYDTKFAGDFDEQVAGSYKEAFDETQKAKAKADIEGMLKVQRHWDEESSYPLVEQAHEAMVKEYPRATGDRSKSYVNLENNTQAAEEEEMQTLTT